MVQKTPSSQKDPNANSLALLYDTENDECLI